MTKAVGMGFRAAWVLAAGGLGLLVAACGPVVYWADVTSARQQLKRAEQRNARAFAAYEFHSAEAYLEKAEEEAAEGHYEEALRFARNAEEFALQAERRATVSPSGLR